MSMNQADDRHVPAAMDTSAVGSGPLGGGPNKGFALSGKIMLTAIVVLILVLILMASLHLYARWYLLRQRRRQLLLRRNRRRNSGNRRAHIVFYVDGDNPNALVTLAGGLPNNHPANKGLEPAVISSLPVFAYSSKTRPEGLECAVCLSEFEEEEKGRILPKCNHSFHTECIDMWFHSHSTCPICRATVEPVQKQDNRVNSAIESGNSSSSSGLCEDCQHQEDAATGSSSSSNGSGSSSMPPPLGSRRKGFHSSDVRIDVPMRGTTTQPDDELPVSSPAGNGFRSPGARLLSLKRILSMGRKTPTGSSSSSAGTSCSPHAAEPDLERGITPAELTRVATPR